MGITANHYQPGNDVATGNRFFAHIPPGTYEFSVKLDTNNQFLSFHRDVVHYAFRMWTFPERNAPVSDFDLGNTLVAWTKDNPRVVSGKMILEDPVHRYKLTVPEKTRINFTLTYDGRRHPSDSNLIFGDYLIKKPVINGIQDYISDVNRCGVSGGLQLRYGEDPDGDGPRGRGGHAHHDVYDGNHLYVDITGDPGSTHGLGTYYLCLQVQNTPHENITFDEVVSYKFRIWFPKRTASFGEAALGNREWLAVLDDREWVVNRPAKALTLPEATGGDPPLSYSISPTLPEGLTFEPSTRVLSGTPVTAMEATSYNYVATDADGDEATLTFKITVWSESETVPTVPTDRDALVALYNATGGAWWTNKANWLSERPIGEWDGVTTDSAGRVTRLFLDNKGLVGSLPPELGNLSRLEYLNPSRNAGLRGPLPVEMGRLSGLSVFYANGTGLCVPPALSAWHAAIGTKIGPPACGDVPSFGGLTVGDQDYRVGTPVADLTLPAATGGDAPLSYSISPALPAGLVFDAAARVLSGTPTVAQGTTIYTYTARDSDGDTAQLTFAITATDPERDALVALYHSTGGANWTWNTNWLSERPISEWHGVTTDSNGRVTRLDLNFNQLTGSIPPELGNLSGLETLYLSRNQLSGSIPPELGNLSSLRYLYLDANNGLTGPLPREMERLTNLRGLRTQSTRLCLPPALSHRRAGIYDVADIPVCGVPTFGTATVAHQSYVRGMPIAGLTLPAAVGGDGTLSYTLTPALPTGLSFDASARVLSGTPTAVRPTTVYTYMVSDADGDIAALTFSITVTAGRMTLDLERDALVALYDATNGANWTWNTNWLSERPIGEWRGVRTDSNGQVTSLYLSDNQLTGSIPPELGNLSSLETLNLSGNRLTGSIPPELGNLSSLKFLHLSGNQLTGSIPPELGNLSSLETLYLGGNNGLTGPLPLEMGRLTNLRDLGTSSTRLCLPPALVGWHAGVHDVFGIPVCRDVLTFGTATVAHQSYVRGMPITDLTFSAAVDDDGTLSYTLTPALPAGLSFDASARVLSGTPTTVRPTTVYTYMVRDADGETAQLAFTIAVTVDGVTSDPDRETLVALYHATGGANWTHNTNWLSERPMGEWQGVTTDGNGRVTRLELPGNQLIGSIPPELGNLSSLETLYLSDNQLTGSIPPELGNLSSLETLYLSDNQLTGSIPPELGNLSSLETLYLGGNNGLTGPLPLEMGRLTNLRELDTSSTKLCLPPALSPWRAGISHAKDIPVCGVPTFGTATVAHQSYVRGMPITDLTFPAAVDDDGTLSYTLTPALPAGLSFDASARVLSGTPTTVRPTTVYTYMVRNANGETAQLAFTITVTPDGMTLDLERDALVALYHATGGANWTRNTNWLSERPIGEWDRVSTDSNGQVTSLYLFDNQLIGSIPPELGNLSSLETLNLSGNRLTGSIPPELGNLSSLETLYLSGNNGLTGPLPREMGRLTNLRDLGTSSTRLCLPPALVGWHAGIHYVDGIPVCRDVLTFGTATVAHQSYVRGMPITDLTFSAAVDDDGTLSYTLTPALPAGLSFDASARVLSGTPTTVRPTTVYTYMVRDADGETAQLAFTIAVTVDGMTSDPDREALVALYHATGGANWTRNTNWLSERPIGEWQGVTTDGNGRVTRLDLGGNRLSNSHVLSDFFIPLPSELGNLSSLETLDLSHNQLTDWIPPELGNLSSLETLYLSDNQLTGSIPPELGNLSSLKFLYLSDNQLTGSIPPELGNLSSLETLDLSDNQLAGSIRPELGNLSRLHTLFLSRNQLTGSIPPELGHLSSLLFLHLGANNGLTGSLPPEMGRLTYLRFLDTSSTRLCLPPALAGWYAGIHDVASITVCGLTFRTATVAHQSYVRGMPIADLTLPAAADGDGTLSYTLTPALPAGLSFDASARVLSGTPTAVRPTAVYTYMVRDADGETAQLAFTIAVTVDGMTSDPDREALVALYHATGGANWTGNTNWLSERPIGEWQGVSTDSNGRVTRLFLSRNQLTGSIPSELGNLSSLRYLYLGANNGLTGPLPREMERLTNLRGLRTSSTRLCLPPALMGWHAGIYSVNDTPVCGAPTFGTATVAHQSYVRGMPIADLTLPAAIDGDGTLRYTLTPALPAGLSFDESARVLSGTPTAVRPTTVYKYMVRDADGETAQLAFTIAVTVDGMTSDPDREALVELYHATGGANWTGNTNWLSERPIGEWQGVTADSNGRVTRLSLSGNRLTGSIPPELGNLSGLVGLNLSHNWLTGSIPPELGKLLALEYLYLDANNGLTGPLPLEMGRLTDLSILDTSSTKLCLPPALSPWRVGILYAEDIPVCGVPTFGTATVAHQSYVRGTSIAGLTLPAAVGADGTLSYTLTPALPAGLSFDESARVLYGTPTTVRPTTVFTYMVRDAGGETAQLAFTITVTVDGMATDPDRDALVALYHATGGANWTRNTNWLSEQPIGEWHGVTTDRNGRVTHLSLPRNQLTGLIPPELGNLSGLATLDLSGNQLTGSIPPELGNLSSLRYLYLGANNGLTGPLPLEMGRLTNLLHLGTQSTKLCLPPALSHWYPNRGISIALSACSGVSVDRDALVALYHATGGANWTGNTNWLSERPIGEWHGVTADSVGRVTGLSLENNRLTGPIPPELGNLSSLLYLYLGANNGLTGPLPLEMGRLTNLNTLDTSSTRLCLPQALGGWHAGIRNTNTLSACSGVSVDRDALVALYDATGGADWTRSTNWLSKRPIGEWHGVSTDSNGRVTRLSLSRNQLSGSIPPELGNLSGLATLDLSYNQLSGSIPPELGNLYRVVEVRLNGNDLCLPPTLASWYGGIRHQDKVYSFTPCTGVPTVSVADARAKEGRDPSLNFAVTLDRAATSAVTVDYATADGSAAAGKDYRAARGTLTFRAGERLKMVSIAVLDDFVDEGEERMTFLLFDVSGAYLEDGVAAGTIVNTDPMPSAWLARFGRTVTGQVLDAIEARLEAPKQAELRARLAGQALPLGSYPASADNATESDAMEAIRTWIVHSEADDALNVESRTLTGRDFVTGTSFALTESMEHGGFATVWGQGAITRFNGREGVLTLDGEVATGLVGADWASARWTGGLAVGYSRGTGGYREPKSANEVEASLTVTGVYPYAGLTLTDRISVWTSVGYGAGKLTLEPDGQAAITTDLTLAMGAAGIRSELLMRENKAGLSLAIKGDTRFTRISSEASEGPEGGRIEATDADVWLVRTNVEGSRRFVLGGDTTLTPSFEVGVRLDGGDAETGFGADLSGGLSLANPQRGLALDLKGRGLIVHEARGFREWGASGSLTWDPLPETDRGVSLLLRQSWGAPSEGGADALLERETLAGIVAADNGVRAGAGRLEAELSYGLPVFGGAFTGVPHVGFALTDTWRDYKVAWRLASARRWGFEAEFEAKRRETANGNEPAELGTMLRVTIRW